MTWGLCKLICVQVETWLSFLICNPWLHWHRGHWFPRPRLDVDRRSVLVTSALFCSPASVSLSWNLLKTPEKYFNFSCCCHDSPKRLEVPVRPDPQNIQMKAPRFLFSEDPEVFSSKILRKMAKQERTWASSSCARTSAAVRFPLLVCYLAYEQCFF